MRRGIPCRTFRGCDHDASRRIASMGQREVQIQADGHAAWRAETVTMQVYGLRRDGHIDNRREA